MDQSFREPLEPDVLAHFGLADDPFLDSNDVDDVWMSPTNKWLEGRFNQAMRRYEIIAFAGPSGAGKSTLSRRFFARAKHTKETRIISPASINRGRIDATSLSVAIIRDLVKKDTSSFPMEARSELLRSILAEMREQRIHPALVIDEAHLLSSKAMLAIKQVWDSHLSTRALSVVLVGQPMLLDRLRTDLTLAELRGRTVPFSLKPLGATGSDYLRWRVSRIGGDADKVFSADAMKAIADRAEYPLWINNLAARAMAAAHRIGERRVESVIVGKV